MLRLSELRLPLDHTDEDLNRALLRQLRIPPDHLLEQHLVKRSVDARRRDRIQLIYSLDVRVKGEAAVRRKHSRNSKIRPTPDTRYRPVATAPQGFPQQPEQRPVVSVPVPAVISRRCCWPRWVFVPCCWSAASP